MGNIMLRGEKISKSHWHDAGAYGQCSYCNRYSDDIDCLDADYLCNCGKKNGFCGSFEKPTTESIWHNWHDNRPQRKTKRQQICPHCKEEIPMQMVQQGGLHMGCFEADIDVFFISLPDAPLHGFYEIDPSQVMEQLKSAEVDEPYLIQKKEIKAGLYYNLTDFQGF